MTNMKPIQLKLLIFTRYPEPGRAKSRLIPALGAAGAARLQRRMSEEALAVARRFRAATRAGDEIDTTIRVCFTGASAAAFRAWLGDDLEYQRQAEGDLGRKMSHAFDLAFRPRLANQSCDGLECGIPLHERRTGNETEMALVVGADLPGLTTGLLEEAVERLKTHGAVLGPAADGGYYLLGIKEPQPELFRNINWGTDRVAEQTLVAAASLGLPCSQLPPLTDIDRPEDIAMIADDPRFATALGHPPRLSVIIPTLNEAAVLADTLEQLQKNVVLPDGDGSPAAELEIIVADGGSRDATREIAAGRGAAVIEVDGGRAAQLNAGAARARGDWLLFLHADTLPPPGYPELILQALDDPATVAGAFRLGIEGEGAALRLVELGANLRSRWLRMPYGDQGIFLSKRVFEEVGGFAPLPIMEDFQLIRRLGRRGPVVTLPQAVRTAARRWRQMGVLRTCLINQLMLLGFRLGVAPQRLARFYRLQRGKNRKPKKVWP